MKKKASEYPAKRKRMAQELKEGRFSPSYLVYGEEAYLRAQNRALILQALGAREGDMNFTRFSGRDIRADAVIEMAETLPFFAEYRVILVEDSGFFAVRRKRREEDGGAEAPEDGPQEEGGGEEGRKLAAYLPEQASTVRIVFCESDCNRTTSLFKAVDKHGFTLPCDPPSEAELRAWVSRRAAANGMRIEARAVERLLFLGAGGAANDPRIDMNLLSCEMEKLFSYCLGRDAVRLADVDAVCSDVLSDRIFAMIDRMADGKRQEVAAIYQDMLALRHPPQLIFALIVRQFNNILQVSELLGTGRPQEEVARRVYVQSFMVPRYAAWGRSYTRERLLEILSACAECDLTIKRGGMDATVAIEALIAACVG